VENLLKNKTAVITGGCGQIGYATAIRLAEQGARIISLTRSNLEKSQEMFNQLPNQHLQHQVLFADIMDTKSIKAAAEKIDSCDILVNAAGITRSMDGFDIASYTDEILDEILQTNLKGPLVVIRELYSKISKSDEAVIINVSSTSMFRASPSNMMYGASKAGLEVLTKYLSRGLSPNVRVVSVCPGFLEKPTSGAIKPPGSNEKISKQVPLGRVGTGDDVAVVIESLCTGMKYVNGTSILVDGGRLA